MSRKTTKKSGRKGLNVIKVLIPALQQLELNVFREFSVTPHKIFYNFLWFPKILSNIFFYIT